MKGWVTDLCIYKKGAMQQESVNTNLSLLSHMQVIDMSTFWSFRYLFTCQYLTVVPWYAYSNQGYAALAISSVLESCLCFSFCFQPPPTPPSIILFIKLKRVLTLLCGILSSYFHFWSLSGCHASLYFLFIDIIISQAHVCHSFVVPSYHGLPIFQVLQFTSHPLWVIVRIFTISIFCCWPRTFNCYSSFRLCFNHEIFLAFVVFWYYILQSLPSYVVA